MSAETETGEPLSNAKVFFACFLLAQVLIGIGIWLITGKENAQMEPVQRSLSGAVSEEGEEQRDRLDQEIELWRSLPKTDPAEFDHIYEGNRKMAALLADVLKNRPDEDKSLQCDLCLENNRAAVKKADGTPGVIQCLIQLGNNLLHADRPQEALVEFKRLQVVSKRVGSSSAFLAKVHDRLGTCNLRMAVQSNCIDHHSPQSCIFPLEGSGIHQDPTEVAKAARHFEAALELQPDSLNYRWMLNICYMALGKYPHDVPDKWLIPPKCFESDYDIGRFTDVASAVGVDAIGLSGGCVVDDFNNDGYMDVMASSSGLRDSIKYFLNKGDGTFEDKTVEAQLEGLTGGLNLCHGDFDNDGFVDVYVIRGAWNIVPQPFPPNSLLRNRGDGTFEDVTDKAGLLDFAPGLSAQWADFDNDGWLDLCVGNESKEGADVCQRGCCAESPKAIFPVQLFRNNQDGTFTESDLLNETYYQEGKVAAELSAFVRGVVWGDYNNDDRQDLYITTWDKGNLLFKNTKEGFVDVTRKAGVKGPPGSFPAWFWDYNNDGWLDIFTAGGLGLVGDEMITAMAAYALARGGAGGEPKAVVCNALYKNNGDGTFVNLAEEAKLKTPLMPMGTNFGDLDNDGFPDFYVGNGDIDFNDLVPNRMFRNAGGKFFQDVTTSGGFGHLQKGHGIAFVDMDNDGDQDVYVVMGGSYSGDSFQNALFINPGHGNHWISLTLEGRKTNRSAIGVRVRVKVTTAEGERDIHTVVSGGGSFGASAFRRDIGLGKATAIRFIEVHWPTTGKTQKFQNVAMDKSYRLIEGDAEMAEVKLKRLKFAAAGENNKHLQQP